VLQIDFFEVMCYLVFRYGKFLLCAWGGGNCESYGVCRDFDDGFDG
jgi:hypothetical protein